MNTTFDLRQTPPTGAAMNFRYQPESRPLDGYTIKRAIQRGGFGEVYYALSDAGKEVALKLLHDNTDVELRGVSHCLNLSHPNVMTIFDVRESDGDYWIVMEYIGGKTFDQIIAEHPNGLPHAEVSRLLSGLAAGVDFLNERGIVHRDLKPANIYTENGHVKVGDVGLSKFISVSRRSAHTHSVGTVYYMAPEIAHGRYGREVDVYAVAVILFEMLTGKVPFDGETTGEILMKQLTEKPDLASLPAQIQPVLARGLIKDPLKRTPTVRQLAEEFETALRADPISETRETTATTEKLDWTPDTDETFRSAGSDSPARQQSWPRTHRPSDHVTSVGSGAWYTNPKSWILVALAGVVAIFVLPLVVRRMFSPVMVILVPIIGLAAACAMTVGLGQLVVRAFRLSQKNAPTGVSDGPVRRGIRTNSRYVRYLSPETTRHISLLQRSAELTGSMSIAALCGTIIAGALFVSGYFTAPMAVFFGAVTTMTAWAAMLPAKLWEGRGGNGSLRRLLSGLSGCLVGAAAFTLDQGMMLHLDVHDYSRISDRLGNFFSTLNLTTAEGARLTGYMIFFGFLLLARRWWFHVDSYRPKRVRILSVVWTAIAALLITTIPKFPHEMAILIAAAASAIAQASSVWQDSEQRNISTGKSGPTVNPETA